MSLAFASIEAHSHPICSEEDGVFKSITAKEDNLTEEKVSEYLDIIRNYSLTDMSGKLDHVDVSAKMSFIRLFFEKKQLEVMVKEGRTGEIGADSRKGYCKEIGKLPKLHNKSKQQGPAAGTR